METANAPQLRDVEQRLARLESIELIKQLQVAYASACDANYDADAIASLFATDGVWDGGSLGRCEGREAIRDRFATTHERVLWAMHFMIAPKIEIDADDPNRAHGSWYLLEPATMATQTGGEPYWIATIYDIDYGRDDTGHWRFQRMSFTGGMRARYETGWGAAETGAHGFS